MFSTFLRFLRSGASRKAPGSDFDLPGALPDRIFIGFSIFVWPDFCRVFDTFLLIASGTCRGFSGSVGALPGPATNLSNPLCGVPLGYGDLAQRFKFAVPLRGAGVVLDQSVKSPGPEGLPFLTFPAASARPPTLPAEVELPPFFRFFSH